ncbi:S-layer homology domain-containing protein [Brevibacillus borstelensis]|uniref:S-layer homology domain-containing protein n=2 Tax=Brevibacillus borstelensis TaxID=45462 RepID=UPI001D1375A4|nr:S-layer homology domain-containing protein [Brevibacillus borstelensis]MCM3625328.1 S-layer homology domain-containing protein [Brevibacillus borstelensis]
MQDSGSKKKDRLLNNIPQEQFVCTRGGEPKVMKKVVNSVLASALALTVAPMVVGAEEAAQTENTQTEAPKMDAELQKVVNRLNALGVVQGYGDGDFKVDQTINRAEFATLITRIRGLEQGAKFAQYQSTFTDVNSSDWFAGFVNVASGQEIIKGFPDKSFKPKNDVTYAEAVTMLIRALGYEPSVKGVWPNNMIAKASELNIAKSITAPNNAATRGDIFKMIDNALRVKLMEQQDYGVNFNFQITNETLLTRYMKVKVRDMEWAKDEKNGSEDLPLVTNVPVIGLGTLKANEVTLNGKNAGLGTTTYKVAESINPNEFAGQHVQVWIKDDKENTIVWMEGSEDEEVIMDRLSTFYFNDTEIKNGKTDNIKKDSDLEDVEVELDGNGKTYRFTKDTQVTYNFKPFSDATKGLKEIIAANDGYSFSAKVVLDDKGDISYIHVIDDQTLNKSKEGEKYGSKVIEKVDVDKKKITNLGGGSFAKLEDLDEGKDFLVFRDNKPAKLADLKPMDVYSVYYADGKKEKMLVFATSTVVEGKVDKITMRSETDNRIVIGDKTYRFRTGATFSDNQNKDITELDSSNWDKIDGLTGETVKLYLDASGRIRHIETTDGLDSRRFKAIVTTGAETRGSKITFSVMSQKGKTYNIELTKKDIYDADGKSFEKKDKSNAEVSNILQPSKEKDKLALLEVSLDSKGEVEKVKVLDSKLIEKEGTSWLNVADKEDEMVDKYEVTSDTAIFDMTGELDLDEKPYELKKPGVAKFKDIAEKKDLKVFYSIEDDEVEAIFVVKGKGLASKMFYGQVKQLSRGTEDTIELITKEEDGTGAVEKTYKLDDDARDLRDAGISNGDVIAYRFNSDGEVVIDDVIKVVQAADDLDIDGNTVTGARLFNNKDYRLPTDEQLEEAEITKLDVAVVKKATSNRIEYINKKGETDHFTVKSKTAYVDATDVKVTDSVNDGDLIILIDSEEDKGTAYDYVFVVGNKDDLKRQHGKEDSEKIIAEFLKQAKDAKTPDDGGEPAEKLFDKDSLKVKSEEKMPGFYLYTISGEGVNGAKVTVTIETEDDTYTNEEPVVVENGKFTVNVVGPKGAKKYKIVASKSGNEDTTYTGTIE